MKKIKISKNLYRVLGTILICVLCAVFGGLVGHVFPKPLDFWVTWACTFFPSWFLLYHFLMATE